MESIHPKDIFIHRPSSSTCPIDYATQWYPKYYRRSAGDIYEMYTHYRDQCQRVDSIDSYTDVLILVRELADNIPWKDRRVISCWNVDLLRILGLDALVGYYNWVDDEILTPVQVWGRNLIAPYTIRDIDKEGDMRVVITKSGARRFAWKVKELRVGYSLLFICKLYTRRWVPNRRLNRFMNILEELL